MGRALAMVLAIGILTGCGSLTSRENAALLRDFEDMVDYDNPPVLVTAVRPEYPEMVRQVGAEGRVVLKVLVLENGRVGAVQIIESPNDILANQAITAIRESSFAPATKSGEPCRATTVIPFIFESEETRIQTRAGLDLDQSGKPVDDPHVSRLPESTDEQLTPSK